MVSVNNITITLKHQKPLYIELYEEMKNKIDQGELKGDEKLPSKRILASHLNISINTVQNAYELLLEEGYLYAKEKKGYYVSQQELITKAPDTEPIQPKLVEQFTYDLTTNNNNLLDSSTHAFQKCIKEVLNQNQFYRKTDLEGLLSLRKSIARHLYENRGIEVSEQQIIIGSGMEMLQMVFPLLKATCYALENPGYHKLADMLKNEGYSVEYVPLDEEGVTIPKKGTILYTTSFNQFPTGIKMTIRRKKELIQWVNKQNGYIIEDDFDAEFRINGAPTTALYQLAPERVLFFSTLSSTLCSGFRMAYLILPKMLLATYQNRYQSYTNPVSTLQQQIAQQFIHSGAYARHLNRIKTQLLTKRQSILTALRDIPNLKVDTKRNFLSVIIELPFETETLQRAFQQAKIKIHAISDYDIYHIPSKKLLIGYTNIHQNDLDQALILLKEIICYKL